MRKNLIAIVLCFCCCSLASAVPQKALELFQKALVQEQAAGDLKEAIALYQQAAKEAGGDRELAARALVRAAACYEKLASPQAAQLYQEVIRNYPEQREQVATAQAHLQELRRVQSARTNAALRMSSVVAPMINSYCIVCHNQQSKAGGLSLELSTAELGNDAGIWEKVVRRLKSRTMPPADRPRPPASTYTAAVETLESALDDSARLNAQLSPTDLISDIELASRMSNFLWGSDPDATLLTAARTGRLKDRTVLAQQVRRMLADSRSQKFIKEFFDRFLHLPTLDYVQRTVMQPEWTDELKQKIQRDYELGRSMFPQWDEELREALRRETAMFLESQVRDDRPATELWTANYTFLNERVARYYGIPNVSGSNFRRVGLDQTVRGGLLGQGGILAFTSTYLRTSPTLRAKWLFDTFFGIPLPPPPPSTPVLQPAGRSVRKAVEEYDNNPRCSACHKLFDPLGFAFENFDAIGRWRTVDANEPIDASGSFTDGTVFNGPVQFRLGLMSYRDSFLSNVTQKLLTYALRRESPPNALRLAYYHEMPAVRKILRDAAPHDYRWSALVVGIVESVPFQMKNIVP